MKRIHSHLTYLSLNQQKFPSASLSDPNPLFPVFLSILMCIVDGWAIWKVVSITIASFSEEFNPNVRCVYHIDTPDHETENCQSPRHKIQYLIYTRVISIDLSNQKYDVHNPFKAPYASPPII